MFKQLLINDLPFSVKDKRKKQALSKTIKMIPYSLRMVLRNCFKI